MRPYRIKVAAGKEEPYSFGSDRNYIRLDESATVTVTVKSPDTGEESILKSGDWATLSPFDELRISHNGAADTAFTVWVGKDTRQGGSRVGGSVQVTGGSDNAANPPLCEPTSGNNNTSSPPLVEKYYSARRKQSYVASFTSSVVPATFWTVFQLWNPPGSGVDLLIRRAEIGSATSFAGLIGITNVTYGNVVAADYEMNLASGAAAWRAETRVDDDSIFAGMSLPSNTGLPAHMLGTAYVSIADYDASIFIQEGYGLLAATQQTAVANAAFEWDEI